MAWQGVPRITRGLARFALNYSWLHMSQERKVPNTRVSGRHSYANELWTWRSGYVLPVCRLLRESVHDKIAKVVKSCAKCFHYFTVSRPTPHMLLCSRAPKINNLFRSILVIIMFSCENPVVMAIRWIQSIKAVQLWSDSREAKKV